MDGSTTSFTFTTFRAVSGSAEQQPESGKEGQFHFFALNFWRGNADHSPLKILPFIVEFHVHGLLPSRERQRGTIDFTSQTPHGVPH